MTSSKFESEIPPAVKEKGTTLESVPPASGNEISVANGNMTSEKNSAPRFGLDERYYDIVAEELRRGFLHPGLWKRAVVETGSEGDAARVFYIRLRVVELELIEVADRAKARAEKDEQEAREKELAYRKRKFNRWTKCEQCGYVGCMRRIFWTLSEDTPVKCPKCKSRFNWYDCEMSNPSPLSL